MVYKVTISGSFHRHMGLIDETIREFNENGCVILSPKDAKVVDEIGDFLFVSSDLYRSIKIVENRHLLAIGASDFLWLVCPDGYIGQSASLELGFAIAKGKPIYCERLPPDLTLSEYVTVCKSPFHAVRDYARLQRKQELASTNILLEPAEGAREAHRLIDEIAYCLTKPALLNPTDFEKKLTILNERLMLIFNMGEISFS